MAGSLFWFLGKTEGTGCRGSSAGVGFVVVFLEEIDAEVVGEVAPDCVGVVGVVLGVVVFEEELGALDSVVVGLAEFGAAGPCEG